MNTEERMKFTNYLYENKDLVMSHEPFAVTGDISFGSLDLESDEAGRTYNKVAINLYRASGELTKDEATVAMANGLYKDKERTKRGMWAQFDKREEALFDLIGSDAFDDIYEAVLVDILAEEYLNTPPHKPTVSS